MKCTEYEWERLVFLHKLACLYWTGGDSGENLSQFQLSALSDQETKDTLQDAERVIAHAEIIR